MESRLFPNKDRMIPHSLLYGESDRVRVVAGHHDADALLSAGTLLLKLGHSMMRIIFISYERQTCCPTINAKNSCLFMHSTRHRLYISVVASKDGLMGSS